MAGATVAAFEGAAAAGAGAGGPSALSGTALASTVAATDWKVEVAQPPGPSPPDERPRPSPRPTAAHPWVTGRKGPLVLSRRLTHVRLLCHRKSGRIG